MLSGENVSQWYFLLKEVLADIRGQAFKNKREKLDKYKNLYQAIRGIHEDYVRIFTNLIDDLLSASTQSDIKRARKNFLIARKVHSGDRTLTKFDAQTYLSLAEDLSEKRYLLSVVTYFYYDMDGMRYASSLEQVDIMIWEAIEFGGDHGWNSASTRFWVESEYLDSRDELREMAKSVLFALGERFAILEKTHSELDGNWRHSKAISRSKVTELLESSNIVKPSDNLLPPNSTVLAQEKP